jgi:hypothetical protein
LRYPNSKIRGKKLGLKTATRKPEIRGYPPQTQSVAILRGEISYLLKLGHVCITRKERGMSVYAKKMQYLVGQRLLNVLSLPVVANL